MYDELMQSLYEDSLFNPYQEYVEVAMEKQKKEAVQTLAQIVSPDFSESFLRILSFAYENDQPDAEKIVDLMGFDQRDFAAINNNQRVFEKFLDKENEDNFGPSIEEMYI